MSNPCFECAGCREWDRIRCEKLKDYYESIRFIDEKFSEFHEKQKEEAVGKIVEKQCDTCHKAKGPDQFEEDSRTCNDCWDKINAVEDEVDELYRGKDVAPAAGQDDIEKPSAHQIGADSDIRTASGLVALAAAVQKDCYQCVSASGLDEHFKNYPMALEALKKRADESVRNVKQQIVFEMKCLAEGLQIFDPNVDKQGGTEL